MKIVLILFFLFPFVSNAQLKIGDIDSIIIGVEKGKYIYRKIMIIDTLSMGARIYQLRDSLYILPADTTKKKRAF